MVSLSIITGVCGSLEITGQWFEETIGRCEDPHEVILVSNGNTKEENQILFCMLEASAHPYRLETRDTPLGSTKALNLGADVSTGDVLVFIHNDVMIKTKGWDRQLLEFFNTLPEVGAIGLLGGKGIGAHNIYKEPYHYLQLGRHTVYNRLIDWSVHGLYCGEPVEVAVLDGLMISCFSDRFFEIGGFDVRMIHHMYDNDISLSFLKAGYVNYVVPILAEHISGQTANFPRYNDYMEEAIGKKDIDIYMDSHRLFYDKWRGTLPLSVN